MELNSSPLATAHPFPAGLQVLLLDEGDSGHTTLLLQELQYRVTHAPGPQQAADLLQHSSPHFDVILADAAVLGPDLGSSPSCAVFKAAASRGTPVVLLMGGQQQQHSSTEQVMAAVQAGAADVLERPLCHSKLANLWQHTVRASLLGGNSNSKSVGGGASQHSSLTHQQRPQQQQQLAASPRAGTQPTAAAAGGAAAGAPAMQHSPMCFGLLGDDLPEGVDGLGGLELPPLVPSQLELEHLDSILSDLHADPSSAVAGPLLGSLTALLPPGSPSNSNAATAVAASLFGGSSSEQQQCSGNTQAAAGELESCADAPSAAAGSPLNRRRKLRACTSLRSMSAAAAASAGACAGSAWPAAAAGMAVMPPMGCFPMHMQPGDMSMPMPMPMHMNMPPAGMMGPPSSAGHWGTAMNMGMSMGMPHMPMPMNMNMMMPPMHGQLPRGMVWGMPMRSVAVAPGLVPAAPAPAGGQQQGSTPRPTLATAVAPAVQQQPQPQQQQQQQQQPCGMPMPMWGAGMWAGGVMWGPMCPPGMLPAQTGLPAAPALSAAGAQGLPQFCGAATQPAQTGHVC